jgi:hypothetical protein
MKGLIMDPILVLALMPVLGFVVFMVVYWISNIRDSKQFKGDHILIEEIELWLRTLPKKKEDNKEDENQVTPEEKKAYHKKKSADWYQNNKELTKERMGDRPQTIRREKKRIVQEIKSNNPCTDCGQFFHYSMMDFDHVRGVKIGDVGTLSGKNAPLKVILEEIEKCELVCANCHRYRSWTRMQGE